MKKRSGLMKISEKYRNELAVYLPLAFVGGFLEIYTFLNMDGLFANSQTSNIVMFFQSICAGDKFGILYCFIPIIIYMLGIAVTEIAPQKISNGGLRWPKICLLIEILCIIGVGFVPANINGRISALPIFFLTALQYNTFKSMQGQAVSTVFCTNNLRQVVIHLCRYKEKNNPDQLIFTSVYVFVILSFGMGVVLGFYLSNFFAVKAVWICAVIMAAVMFKISRHGHILA